MFLILLFLFSRIIFHLFTIVFTVYLFIFTSILLIKTFNDVIFIKWYTTVIIVMTLCYMIQRKKGLDIKKTLNILMLLNKKICIFNVFAQFIFK